jgi:hypothetical protein
VITAEAGQIGIKILWKDIHMRAPF